MSGDRWLRVSISAPPRGEAYLLVDALRSRGAVTIGSLSGRVVAVFPEPEDVPGFLDALDGLVRANSFSPGGIVDWASGGSESWEGLWDREIRPVAVTDRILVRPIASGGDPEAQPSDPAHPFPGEAVSEAGTHPIQIALLPGTAFGVPYHPTTLSCLQCLDGRVRKGDRILDVGTGSGILAIAAARLGAEEVLAVDSDSTACELARRNARANGIEHVVRIREARAEPRTPLDPEPFDGVIANLEPSLLIPLIPRLVDALGVAGWLLLSGVPEAETPSVLEAVASASSAGPAHTRRDSGTRISDSTDRSGISTVRRARVRDGWWTGIFSAVP